jgi:small subunit ribosomal protein S1
MSFSQENSSTESSAREPSKPSEAVQSPTNPTAHPDPTASPAPAENAEANKNSEEEGSRTDDSGLSDSAKARIKIGTQRQGTAIPKIAPRVVTDFKTPPKQVFVSLDQEGNFAPVAPTVNPSATAAQNQQPKPVQQAQPRPQGQQPAQTQQQSGNRPPQQQQSQQRPLQHKQRSGIDDHDAAAASEGASILSDAAYRPKPAPLGKNDIKQRENFNPTYKRVEKPSTRGALSDDLEAELAAALGEDSLDDLIQKTGSEIAGTQLESDTKQNARVLRVSREFVFVELPGMNQGAMSTQQFGENIPEPGTILEVLVNRFSAEEGLYEVSLTTAAVDIADWSQVSEGMVVNAKISGHNKGGVECEVNRLRGFIPAGQLSLYRVENLEQFVGQTLMCIVTEANRERRNLILSHRAILEREQAENKQKLLAELEPGQEREGIVRSLRDFGAFVDLGGVDGLIHISQLSWDRVKHPSEVLSEGQKVKVKVQKIDPDTGKIGLSLRDLYQSPWATATMKYPVSSTVTGKVSRIMDFGAFVKLESGLEGLVHISELSYKRVFRASDVLTEGQEVDVKVLSIDPDAQKMGLSIKALTARPEPTKSDAEKAEEAAMAQEPVAPRTPKIYKTPLKGGTGRATGGDQFGLKW